MKFFGFGLGDLWKLKKASDQFERDKKMQNYEWQKSLKAGVTQILTLILTGIIAAVFGVLSDSENIKTILLGAGVNEAYVAVILMLVAGGLRVAQNWMKHSPNAPRPSSGDIPAVVALLLLPALASPTFAQEPEKANSITLSSGATRFFTPGIGDSTEMEGQLLVHVQAPNLFVVEGFSRFTRVQGSEPGAAGLLDSSTFRAIVGHLAVHRRIGGPVFDGGEFGAGCSAGVSWSRDKAFDPSDPNIWAVGCGPRIQIPRGSLTVKVGHNGSVGGYGVFGELVINQGSGVRYLATYAVPFDAARFRQNPGTFTGGVQVDVKAWRF